MKIVYCTNSTEPSYGGIEVVTVAKANALADVLGNEVWIVVTDQMPESARGVSKKVHVIDLNINYYDDDSVFKLICSYTIKRWKHRHVMQKLMEQIDPDVVISTSKMEKYMLPQLKYRRHPLLVREIHHCRQFRKLNAQTWWKKLYAMLVDWYDYKVRIAGYDKIVVLTDEDKKISWKDNQRVVVIPNPILDTKSDNSVSTSEPRDKTVVAIGRLMPQKNFLSAIRVWKRVNLKHPDWELHIWGEGLMKQELQKQIDSLSLNDKVRLMGYSANIQEKMKAASLLMMTSLYEGFGMVLIEGMQMGLPAISYACPCGPKDIIDDGVDGFLVTMGDETMMAEKICALIEDEHRLEGMREMARKKAEKFNLQTIIAKWMAVFEQKSGSCIVAA